MKIPTEYDEIRPYSPEELPAAFDALLADPAFCGIMQSFFKGIPPEALKAKIYAGRDNLEVQKNIFYPLVQQLIDQCCTSLSMDCGELDRNGHYTFISNHRDIVIDPAFLSILLLKNGFPTTVEIAIGDNLLIHPWIKTLVRINKSFIVQRSLPIRELLASSRRMSGYMHFAIAEKHENLWIAQREGRAKDSDDRTQESVLKMLALGGEGTPLERLKSLHIVPLAISYEYDPCDYLKAQEFQQKRDDPAFRKSQADDLQNMQTGIFGRKGRVHYQTAPCINGWLDEMAALPKTELFGAVARRMDREIHRSYKLYPGNYVAADLLQGGTAFSAHYSEADRKCFEDYLGQRLALVSLPQPDQPFLRQRILEMYANPLLNQLKAQ